MDISTMSNITETSTVTTENNVTMVKDIIKLHALSLWLQMTSDLVIIMFIVISNGLVLWTVYKVSSLHTITSIFIVNLSAVDLISGVVAVPINCVTNYIIPLTTGTYTDNKYLCILKTFLLLLCIGLSIYGLVAICIERYIAVIHPLRYYTLMTAKRSIVLLACIWSYCFIACGLMFFDGFNTYQVGLQCSTHNTLNPTYFMFLKLNTLVPFLVTIVVYSRITWVAMKHRLKIQSVLASIDNARAVAYNNDRYVALTMGFVQGVFLLMYTPFIILSSLPMHKYKTMSWFTTVWYVTSALLYINSGVNPWIYVIRLKRYRDAMKVALRLTSIQDTELTVSTITT
ncbi:unnamed protein product [Owenia fusiformis]|uniref:Uncharacterized protein n=1 Tax=Owenia fusiformis TaxID=6347 RepID=A0A8J1UV26_OWEFU|nr:unnamed protein product [Owenia fusiformis]